MDQRKSVDAHPLEKVGWPTGFEPATTSSTSLDSTIELWPPAKGDIIFFTGPGVKLLSSARVADNLTADKIMISSGRRWEEGFQSANLKYQMAGAGSLTIEKYVARGGGQK